jgi:hypothetical protein
VAAVATRSPAHALLASRRVALRAIALVTSALLASSACTRNHESAPRISEPDLRRRLGVPEDAKQVVVFAQNAHLDIDWQQTFEGYYGTWVESIFTNAKQILDDQPSAYYSVAEMAYLEHHLEQHPEALAMMQSHAARGALRIVGGGMTSPDTLLPETEMIVRDYLFGAAFSEDVLGARAHAAWLPDSFGHAASVPDLLSALGYESVALGRIDGAPTLLERLNDPRFPIKPGSTAEKLTALRSADFIWRGAGGSRVLAHWFPVNLYCTGDTIDYDEQTQLPGVHFAPFRGDDASYTDGKIDEYIEGQKPYARTPYMFVPVGCDFQQPKAGLVGYLEGYNRRRYPTTHVWAVAAPFEDYALLVSAHASQLPEIDNELTPYFMGYFASRAELKRLTRDAARPFLIAETFALALGDEGAALSASAAPDLKRLMLADHHDFVTGTSRDEVVSGEQIPLLRAARLRGDAFLSRVAAGIRRRIAAPDGVLGRLLLLNGAGATREGIVETELPRSSILIPFHAMAGGQEVPLEIVDGGPTSSTIAVRLRVAPMASYAWRAIDLLGGAASVPKSEVSIDVQDGRVVMQNARVRAQWTRGQSFALTSLVIDGKEALAGPSFLIGDYLDAGGLWRLGNEMAGCTFSKMPVDPSAPTETFEVVEASPLSVRVRFTSATAVREARLDAGVPGLDLALITSAHARQTRTVSFAFAPSGVFRTSIAGGYVDRPAERVYSPTFWAAVDWVTAGEWAVLLRQSTGVSMATPGTLELLAVRDSESDECGFEGVMGSDVGAHRIEWRIEGAPTPMDAMRAGQAFGRPIQGVNIDLGTRAPITLDAEGQIASVSGDGVLTALKPALRGGGVIVRGFLSPGPLQVKLAPFFGDRTIVRADAAERDLETIGPMRGAVVLDKERFGAIATARLR